MTQADDCMVGAGVVNRVQRTLRALEEHHLDPEEMGLSLQCPHNAVTKRVITVATIPCWFCPECYEILVSEMSPY